jgi:flagellar biosynthesis protein FliP
MKTLAALAFLVMLTLPASAQSLGLERLTGQTPGAASAQIIQLFGLVTVLAIAPGILMTVTSFTRFIIAFSILRTGIGLQSTPANLILTSLALFMTFYVMTPTFDRAWNDGIQPLMRNEITDADALPKIVQPFREFMLANVRDKDLALFADLARERGTETSSGNDVELRVLVPAFIISEIRRGFEIGFLVVVPFLVIDLVVSTITMAMGMMMLPPTIVALPFKILFFVLIDGWNLLVGSLIRSFV